MNMGKPKIRFKGYTEDWEQRKLSELLYLSNEKNDGSYTRDDVLAASLGTELQKKHIYFGLRATDESVKNYKVVLPKDVIYTKSPIKGFPNGIIRTNKGETGIVPTLYCVYHSIDTINPSIIQAYFESKERLDAYLVPLVNIGARNNVNITDKEFINGSICIPKNETEQNRIVDLLEKISNLITLHQRKCEETKKLKKYMLQKMFPKNGESVPEIRFAGFTDAWEQRKVTDLGEIYIGLVTTMTEHYTDKGHLLIRNSDIKDGYFEFGENPIYLDEEFSEQNKSRMHQLGDVITVHTGDIGTSAVIGENEVNSIGFATIVTRPNQEILDSNYFATYLNTDIHKQWAISMATGDGRSNYNLKDYTKLVVPIPQIGEQKKMAACIGNLNGLITLHQRKCDELKNMKQYMLQNMFV